MGTGTEEVAEPITPSRLAAARDLVVSNTARAWGTREIDLTIVDRLLGAGSIALPDLPAAIPALFVVAVSAVCSALREVPMLNSRWADDGIRVYRSIDIGLELPTGRAGRVVPVVKDADRLSLTDLGAALAAAARRAQPEDGTFTVGYAGAHGSIMSRPLLHEGQAGIYHLGRARRMPRVVDDAISIRTVAYASLAFDHRILDGSTSSRFQNLVKARLESWTPEDAAIYTSDSSRRSDEGSRR